jgi:hypothetical protein
MLRLKWIELQTNHSLATIAERLKVRAYRKNNAKIGFEILEIHSNQLRARFIKEEEVTEVSQDPYGETITTSFVRFWHFEFTLMNMSAKLFIRMHSPPRRLSDFVQEFSLTLDHDIALKELKINIEQFVFALRRKVGSLNVRVESVLYSDVPISETSVGRVQISSKRDAIKDYAARLSGGRLDRATLFVKHGHELICMEVSSRGALKIDDEQISDFELLDQLMSQQS